MSRERYNHRLMKRHVSKMETSELGLADLRAFCLVVDLGSITVAAKRLGETKGSISRRLSRLEEKLEVLLVRRSPRLVQATEQGLAYRLSVGRALEQLDDAHRGLAHARSVPSGSLRVTAPYDLGEAVFAPLVAAFSARYPKIAVEMILTEHILDFDQHQIDVALRASTQLRDSALIAHKLYQVDAGFYAAPSYLKNHRAPRRPDELVKHPLLLRAERAHQVILLRRGDETVSLRLKPVISASDFSFLREVAIAGAGIAWLPTLLVVRQLGDKRLRRVLPEWIEDRRPQVFLVHQAQQFLPEKTRVFRDFMLKASSTRLADG